LQVKNELRSSVCHQANKVNLLMDNFQVVIGTSKRSYFIVSYILIIGIISHQFVLNETIKNYVFYIFSIVAIYMLINLLWILFGEVKLIITNENLIPPARARLFQRVQMVRRLQRFKQYFLRR